MTDKENKPLELTNTKDGNFGRVATRLLFKQYNKEAEQCLDDWRERFVDQLDPTEYAGAIELVGSWSTWQQFKKNWPSFQKLYLDDWLAEVEVRLRSNAVRSLVKEAQYGKSPAAAAKFLAEGKYKEKKPGRPSNEEVSRQLNIDSRLQKEIANDLERIGLH